MKKISILSVVFLMLLGMIGSAYAITSVALATNSSGAAKDEFSPTDNVYGIGQFNLNTYACSAVNNPCSGLVDLYVVGHRSDWIGNGTEALVDVGDGKETINVSGKCINASGLECLIQLPKTPATKIWAAVTTPGSYDFVIDVDRDAIFDQADPIDNAIIAGFTVLPEFTTIGAALALIGSGLYARYKRRRA